MEESLTFKDLNLSQQVQDSLEAMRFSNPTPIQAQAIPKIIEGKDLIACAQTGTGKTAAFLLPVISRLSENPSDSIDTLILTPTRELAIQIDQQLEGFSYFVPLSSISVYGGNSTQNWDQQRNSLINGVNIVIATPGRLIQHINQGYVNFDNINTVILDEADRMLDMGFYDDLIKITSNIKNDKQTLMFSATMPPKIKKLAKEALTEEHEEVTIAVSKTAEGVLQGAYMVYENQKIPVIKGLLQDKLDELQSVIIFCSSKLKVKNLEKELKAQKLNVASIHSDHDQDERSKVLLDFKNRKLPILIATDIVSRGIDIDSIGLVINYDVPKDPEDYVHRVGRTARANTKGIAITFITKDDEYQFNRIDKLLDKEVAKITLPEEFGDQPDYNANSRGKRKKFNNNGPRKKRKPSPKK
ncbi:DEAD/DEAH box helicase [Aureibacter tunicatorum]|uniref:Superfamily II DNA/RNA helicase n=1 Tax=Aureibacter tunicatorum TaxID=866807 RepID=A0AAE4BPN2_9BACT|nr:DEAD/DEAH box helicase [Aureibacter tunicatorum]MDR6238164.1 superfamily II DNA/RNA helicase [Aureibacter tunicatorum]BDD03197.1 RNA helicase [Aureibacter tunicatorum]